MHTDMDMQKTWLDILEYAKWAPSPHNTQLWKVRIRDAALEVFYDPTRLLPVEDVSGSFMTSGLGIFVEALSIAAAPLGYAIEVDYPETRLSPEGKLPRYFCTVTLRPQANTETLDRELLRSRRTSRLPYKPQAVDERICARLSAEAHRFGHDLVFSTDERLIQSVLILNKDTLFFDMEDPATRKEVDAWVRYSALQAARTKDGLWSRCLRIPGVFMYVFFRWRSIFNIRPIKDILGSFYLRTTSGTKTIGWISGPMETPTDWFVAGRMLMRVWLMMTEAHVYLHPFGSIITNPRSHAQILGLINTDESARQKLWLVIRLGYSDVPPRSHRLAVEDLIIH